MDAPPQKLDPLLRWGLILLVVGTAPLVLLIAAAKLGLTSDPNPNPIGPGLLTFFTFWPSVYMIGFGAARQRRRRWLDGDVSVTRR